MMEMPKPGPGHMKLEKLVGTYEGDEIMHPSEWCPEASTGFGRQHNRLALGGFAIIGDYEHVKDGQVAYTGHGVTTYDPEANAYLLHWFDSMGGGLEIFRGTFENDVMVLTSKTPMGFNRLTWDYSDPTHVQTKMESSKDGETWSCCFESDYKRVS